MFRWSILVGGWLPRLAGESRRVGYVGGGIGGDAGKMLVYALQRHSCRDGSKGKESEREGQKKWLYSLVVEVLEITRQTRQEIDEIEQIVVKGNKTRVSTVHATSKKEPALLQRGTATGRSLGVAHTFPVEQRHASGQRCRKY